MHQSEPRGLTRWLRRLLVSAGVAALAGGVLAVPASAQAETRQSASVQNAESSGPIYQLINRQTSQCLFYHASGFGTEPCSNSKYQRWYWDSPGKNWHSEWATWCMTPSKDLNGKSRPAMYLGHRCAPLADTNHVELGGGLAMISWPKYNLCLDSNGKPNTGHTYAAVFLSECHKDDLGQQWIRKVVG
ncbi:hypothetical protein [Nonomuraea africana]|uniref:hypothetical protein n=1 Tax=Nonomuraea africana TaxID=46171 RepID=UPI0033EF9B65